MSGIRIFNAAVSQYRASQQNLQAIGQARQRLEKENELFELKKKKAELDLEEAQVSGKVKGLQAKFLETQMNDYFKQQEEISSGKSALIDQAEEKETFLSDRSMGLAKHVVTNDPLVQEQLLSPVISSSGGGVVGFKRGKSSSVSTKDIANLAVRLAQKAENSGEYGADPEDYMEKARKMLGGSPSGSGKIDKSGEFAPEVEAKIKDTMKKYGKSREEVIAEARKKGLIK